MRAASGNVNRGKWGVGSAPGVVRLSGGEETSSSHVGEWNAACEKFRFT